MTRKLRCLLGLHKLVPIDFGSMNFKSCKKGWIEQDECVLCGHKTIIRTYY